MVGGMPFATNTLPSVCRNVGPAQWCVLLTSLVLGVVRCRTQAQGVHRPCKQRTYSRSFTGETALHHHQIRLLLLFAEGRGFWGTCPPGCLIRTMVPDRTSTAQGVCVCEGLLPQGLQPEHAADNAGCTMHSTRSVYAGSAGRTKTCAGATTTSPSSSTC